MFWMFDSYHDENGFDTWRRKWAQSLMCILTILVGAFICVAGLYVTIKQLADDYAAGVIPSPFSCSA